VQFLTTVTGGSSPMPQAGGSPTWTTRNTGASGGTRFTMSTARTVTGTPAEAARVNALQICRVVAEKFSGMAGSRLSIVGPDTSTARCPVGCVRPGRGASVSSTGGEGPMVGWPAVWCLRRSDAVRAQAPTAGLPLTGSQDANRCLGHSDDELPEGGWSWLGLAGVDSLVGRLCDGALVVEEGLSADS
jgi:hypothetical protein